MKTYVVGGAVRDRLLGRAVSDRDHVVVGASVDDMIAAGFRPVGRDFPVFLHPITHEEYALARTERKVAPGYAGFVFHADPTVTLEEDLARRDLTINAMAEDDAAASLVDPFHGQRDLALRVFRHVGPAFVEDPVRVLRVARFAARFDDFTIAPETLALMRRMAADGEIDALVPERVWQELSRGLMERRPSRLFEVLREADALVRLLPEVDRLFGDDTGPWLLRSVDRAASADSVLEVRFAAALCAVEDLSLLCRRLAVPRLARDLATIVSRERDALVGWVAAGQPAGAIPGLLDAMERSDAFRRRPRFQQAIDAIAWTIEDGAQRTRFAAVIAAAAAAAAAVDAGAIARQSSGDASAIVPALRAARETAIAARDGDIDSNAA